MKVNTRSEGQRLLEDHLLNVYADVNAKWEEYKSALFQGQCGFSILGSRPTFAPELLIIGENPGFSSKDIAIGEPHIQTKWPDQSYLEGESWDLKDRLRDLFHAAGLESVLRNAVLTNFLFFKSGSTSRETQFRWVELDRSLRLELEKFCHDKVEETVHNLKPKHIMVMGTGAFDRRASFISRDAIKANDGRRRLIVTGEIFETEAFAVMHPSGARWHAKDVETAAKWLNKRSAAPLETPLVDL